MLEITQGKLIYSPSFINIPPFKDIWERDKSKNKDRAAQELSYIYYMASPKSEYANYVDGLKEEKIISDFIKKDKWKPDKLINDGIRKYEEMSQSPSLRALLASNNALDKISDYLNSIKKSDVDEDSLSKIMTAIEKMGKVIAARAQIKEMVEKEQSEKTHVRGGAKVNKYTG